MLKKILITLCAVSVMAISMTAYAAPTSRTSGSTTTTTTSGVTSKGSASDSGSQNTVVGESVSSSSSSSVHADNEEDTSYEDEEASTVTEGDTEGTIEDKPVPTAIAAAQQQTQTGVVDVAAQKANEKKYTTKGGAFLWFLLSVLVNVILSFLIANRFYMLSKKEKNVGAEIKALRRDLEEKFVSNVGGFSEMETDVTNTNDNYSTNGSISMPERSSVDFSADSEDVFKRWDSRMNRRAQKQEEPVDIIEDEEELEEKPRRRYQPSRKAVEEVYEEEEEESTIDSVKKKAKSFLGDIFPFKDED